MTPAQAYRAALEAAAKVAEDYNKDGPDKISTITRQINIAIVIRALPVPEDDGDIDQERIAALEAELARCHARLEIDHLYRLEDNKLVRFEVPMADRLLIPDAVTCRDATIQEFDRQRKARKDMVLVPREPTRAMQDAMLEAIKDGISIAHRSVRHAYRAMIEAKE